MKKRILSFFVILGIIGRGFIRYLSRSRQPV